MLRKAVSQRRPGNVLLWFALTVWVLMAMAALVVDLGIVRANQRQMQSAADMGAVEGVSSDGDPAQRDNVQKRVLAAYQDADGNVLPGGEIETNPYPLPDGFSQGQKTRLKERYVPKLRPNADNAANGDMLVGSYDDTTYDPTKPLEDADYNRQDFTPGGGGAFLVRLRRSGEAIDDDTRSAGSRMPYLFGRGSMRASESKVAGVAVRATSIAAALPVLSAGPTFPPSSPTLPDGMQGATPFALKIDFWTTIGTTSRTGQITDGRITIDGVEVGAFFSSSGTQQIGQPFTAAVTVEAQPGSTLDKDLFRYVPLYTTVGSSGLRVVGFGHLQGVTWTTTGVSFQKRQRPDPSDTSKMIYVSVADRNATTSLTGRLDSTLVPNDVPTLFTAVAPRKVPLPSDLPAVIDPLRAPALVR